MYILSHFLKGIDDQLQKLSKIYNQLFNANLKVLKPLQHEALTTRLNDNSDMICTVCCQQNMVKA